ncbi:MAG: molecular chaperone TorD family protein [Rhodocyclales bacterium]|jgi:TorA maturation chaperone TorD|nr:molecular chaperone TorD family protein [Rhodocyclales bacterium]
MTDYVNGKAGAREDLCRFLSACYCEPGTEFGEEHLFDSMLAAASAVDPALVESVRKLGAEFVAQDMETLLVDYTALFIGPAQPRAMPYASFWLTDDQSMRHEATEAVLDFYEQGGFDVSEEIHELPDHIAVELEFLYALIFARNQAQAEGDTEELSAASALHRRFAVEHMGAWIGPFAAAVNSGAATAFYRELAELTRRFVQMEAESLAGNSGVEPIDRIDTGSA